MALVTYGVRTSVCACVVAGAQVVVVILGCWVSRSILPEVSLSPTRKKLAGRRRRRRRRGRSVDMALTHTKGQRAEVDFVWAALTLNDKE